jgi:hypothetical protein
MTDRRDEPGFRDVPKTNAPQTGEGKEGAPARFGLGNWAAVVILLGCLAAAVGFAVYVWNQLSDVAISRQGWIAMSLGILFTAVVGIGLMVLIFYSSRKNYDQ